MVTPTDRELIRQRFADGTYHNPSYSLPCPCCGKSTTIFERGTQHYCWTCNLEFDTEDTFEEYIDLTEED